MFDPAERCQVESGLPEELKAFGSLGADGRPTGTEAAPLDSGLSCVSQVPP
jgi:hypothetical protein